MNYLVYGRKDGAGIRLRFGYEDELVSKVRSLRVRRYDPTTKEWIIPYTVDAVDDLRAKVGTERVVLHPEIDLGLSEQRMALSVAAVAQRSGDADLGDFEFITEPWPHQRAAVKAGSALDGYALFWEMGTGKTKAAIDIVRWRQQNRGLEHTLITCPNEVTYNWKREIAIHAHEEATILEGALSERDRRIRERRLGRYAVLNIEALSPLVGDLTAYGFGAVVVDESTRIKNHQAQRTKAAWDVGRLAQAKLILSGTPVVQHLYDLYGQFEFLQPGIFGRFPHFKWRYFTMAWEEEKQREVLVPRADTLPELLRIVDSMSYRVTKAEVLPDLPEKMPPQYLQTPLANDQLRAYSRMDRAYKTWLMAQEGTIEIIANLAVTQRLRLSQIAAGFMTHPETGEVSWFRDHSKGKVVDGLVEDLMPGKAVIFAHFRAEIEHYFKRYQRYGSAMIYGGMQPRDRDAIVSAFQGQTEPRVLVCQEGSGGIGINLFAAHTAIYTSRSCSLEHWLQSQDRLHRAGQKSPVTLAIVQGRGTTDEDDDDVLTGKATIADLVTRDKAA